MTITTTTPSEPTGIRPIKMDILIETISLSKAILRSLTPKGFLWIRENMNHSSDFTVTVDREYLNELKEQMRNDGLSVE